MSRTSTAVMHLAEPAGATRGTARGLETAFDGVWVETVHTTGFRNLKHRLSCTDAGVVMCQEMKVPPEGVTEARAALKRLGWRAAIAPATRGPAGGLSGGVCICARAWLDFWPDQVGVIAEG